MDPTSAEQIQPSDVVPQQTEEKPQNRYSSGEFLKTFNKRLFKNVSDTDDLLAVEHELQQPIVQSLLKSEEGSLPLMALAADLTHMSDESSPVSEDMLMAHAWKVNTTISPLIGRNFILPYTKENGMKGFRLNIDFKPDTAFIYAPEKNKPGYINIDGRVIHPKAWTGLDARWKLFEYFIQHKVLALSKQKIVDDLYGSGYDKNLVWVYVNNIRDVLEPRSEGAGPRVSDQDSKYIKTVSAGEGYRLEGLDVGMPDHSHEEQITQGGITIRPGSATFDGETWIPLSERLYDMLQALTSEPGRKWTRRELEEKVWGDEVKFLHRMTFGVTFKRLLDRLRETGVDVEKYVEVGPSRKSYYMWSVPA